MSDPLAENEVVLRGDKQCPHGYTHRSKCDTCEMQDADAEIARLQRELAEEQIKRAETAVIVGRLRATLEKISRHEHEPCASYADEAIKHGVYCQVDGCHNLATFLWGDYKRCGMHLPDTAAMASDG